MLRTSSTELTSPMPERPAVTLTVSSLVEQPTTVELVTATSYADLSFVLAVAPEGRGAPSVKRGTDSVNEASQGRDRRTMPSLTDSDVKMVDVDSAHGSSHSRSVARRAPGLR
jgi:hypothetical protein